jgi:hypothetical protein
MQHVVKVADQQHILQPYFQVSAILKLSPLTSVGAVVSKNGSKAARLGQLVPPTGAIKVGGIL